MRIKKESPVCPKCNGRYVYARIKTNDYWCRYCNFIGSRRVFFRKKRKKQAQKVVIK
ncbi:hypothetical protein ES705_07198 [subsurface metagenome]